MDLPLWEMRICWLHLEKERVYDFHWYKKISVKFVLLWFQWVKMLYCAAEHFCGATHLEIFVALHILRFLWRYTSWDFCGATHLETSVVLHILRLLWCYTFWDFCGATHLETSVVLHILRLLWRHTTWDFCDATHFETFPSNFYKYRYLWRGPVYLM